MSSDCTPGSRPSSSGSGATPTGRCSRPRTRSPPSAPWSRNGNHSIDPWPTSRSRPPTSRRGKPSAGSSTAPPGSSPSTSRHCPRKRKGKILAPRRCGGCLGLLLLRGSPGQTRATIVTSTPIARQGRKQFLHNLPGILHTCQSMARDLRDPMLPGRKQLFAFCPVFCFVAGMTAICTRHPAARLPPEPSVPGCIPLSSPLVAGGCRPPCPRGLDAGLPSARNSRIPLRDRRGQRR